MNKYYNTYVLAACVVLRILHSLLDKIMLKETPSSR